jgi:hypothetical protein
MSYAIGRIIYGISPDSELAIKIDECELTELDGFTTYYSGSSRTTPMMVGAFIKSIDECNDVDLTGLLKELDECKFEYINEFKQARTSLLETLETVAEDYDLDKDIVKEIITWVKNTEPSFKIVWSTS